MKKNYLIPIVLLLTAFCGAQTTQVPGYIIKENGTKSSVYFERSNYNVTPEMIYYATSKGGDLNGYEIDQIEEFGYDDNSVRFKKFKVQVNKSSFKENDASPGKDPVLKKETILLEQIVEGAIDLYAYRTSRNTSYYAAREMQTPELLVYNVYSNSVEGISKNTDYRRTLFEGYGCDSFISSIIADVDYDEKDLTKYILKTNECNGAPAAVFETQSNYKPWSILVGLAVNFNTITADFTTAIRGDAEFGGTSFSPNLRAEYNLDPANNKFTLVGELAYASFNDTAIYFENNQSDFNRQETEAEITYNTLSIGIGPRYYIYASDNLRFYPGVQIQYNSVLSSSELLYDEPARNRVFATDFSFNILAGVEISRKISAEVKLRLRNSFTTANASPAELVGTISSVGLVYRLL
ncbi:outer membrane beta-barrel protein [Nonlabens marinus]|uniref:outer membrane beta-barrel protein n=1 Tax=Nonlabens marinus TaxID=930802 RepID=UPI00130E80F0|nr:outer membrane beta-barrel protein [Nonlabens marinus]